MSGGKKLRHTLAQTLWASAMVTGVARAQSAPAAGAQSFDVASIKANHSGQSVMLYQPAPGGRFTAASCSLLLLIQYAYELNRPQIANAPAWVSTDRFDIAAKGSGNPSRTEIRGMVRRLLEERFRLLYHWESRDATVYSLVVSKPGKLKASTAYECPQLTSVLPSLAPSAINDIPCGGLRYTPGDTSGRKMTASNLAASLSFLLATPVLDKTGLSGTYDIDLRWTPDLADTTGGVSIFTAVQEQLGLKLEPVKDSIKVFAIDHVEKPAED
jgi:uncharacterized protein (TIGR03435 family)